MEQISRYTVLTEKGYRLPMEGVMIDDDAIGGAAVERLARFEDICEDVKRQRDEVNRELEQLRRLGRQRSERFSQLQSARKSLAAIVELLGL